jgi:hypothetical protein
MDDQIREAVVVLDLRTLTEVLRIFDGERVKSEALEQQILRIGVDTRLNRARRIRRHPGIA